MSSLLPPPSHCWIGGQRYPMWELCALAGVAAGSAWALLLSLLLGQPLLFVPLSTTSALCLYIAWLLLRRRMGLAHRHVLVEGLGLALLAVVLVSHALCISPLRGLDIGMVGFALAMVGGRLGCFCAGCCFGLPMVPGLRWPPHCPAGQPPFRRLPIQLVEALLWLVLWAIGSIATWMLPPGQSLGLLLTLYAPARFALEVWRGDEVRGSWRGLSTSQWAFFPMMGLGLYLIRPPIDAITAVAAALCLLAWTLLWRYQSRWLPRRPALPLTELHEAARGWRNGGPGCWSAGEIEAGLQVTEQQVEVWVSGPALEPKEAELLFEGICCGLGWPLPAGRMTFIPGPGKRRVVLLRLPGSEIRPARPAAPDER